MTTVLATFFIAFLVSLGGTPLAGKLGTLIGAVDTPDQRKVHQVKTPRSGGLVVFAGFALAVCLSKFLGTQVSELFVWNARSITFFAGAIVVFGVGFVDDIHRLSPKVKLLFQVMAATIAFGGGLRIDTYYFTRIPVDSVIINYCLTVFWFVLLINAINLIDGLDGLAAGITFFVCVILTILLIWQHQYFSAMLFASLGGAVLGFLRYNFNPASVFMGDGGSYFLGYAIAGLAIMSSVKAETGTVVLIPLLAAGVPIFDAILSPVRRFIVGKKLFQPDKSHVHHKLIAMGFTTRKAVLLIYAISLVLCLFGVAMVNLHDRRAAFFLIVVGFAAAVFTRKLGYLEYLALDKLIGWFKDITDVAGFSHSRRSFLGLQIEIGRSHTMEELWSNVCHALEFLRFDKADLYLGPSATSDRTDTELYDSAESRVGGTEPQRKAGGAPAAHNPGRSGEPVLHWAREQYKEGMQKECMLKIELPLINGSPEAVKTFCLVKDLGKGQMDAFTLRRIEQLRQAVVGALDRIDNKEGGLNWPVAELAGRVRIREASNGWRIHLSRNTLASK